MFHRQKKLSLFRIIWLRHHDSFDECPQFYQPYDYVKKSPSVPPPRWAERGLKAHRRPQTKVFGIVQGADLKICVANQLHDLVSMDFPGTLSVVWQENQRRDECCLDLQLNCCLKINLVIWWCGMPIVWLMGWFMGWICLTGSLPTESLVMGLVWPVKVFAVKMPSFEDFTPLDPECDPRKNPYALIRHSRLMKPLVSAWQLQSLLLLNLMKCDKSLDDNLFGIPWVFWGNYAIISQDVISKWIDISKNPKFSGIFFFLIE